MHKCCLCGRPLSENSGEITTCDDCASIIAKEVVRIADDGGNFAPQSA